MENFRKTLHDIKAFAFDVDGVLTDGGVTSMPDGDLLRTHYARDGYAIRKACECGYPIAIITGGISPSVIKRYQMLGVRHIYSGARNKLPVLMDFCAANQLELHQVAYGGDDIPDIPPMKACGLSFCPSDACIEVLQMATYVSPFGGGKGCVRDIISQVLLLQGNWYTPC